MEVGGVRTFSGSHDLNLIQLYLNRLSQQGIITAEQAPCQNRNQKNGII